MGDKAAGTAVPIPVHVPNGGNPVGSVGKGVGVIVGVDVGWRVSVRLGVGEGSREGTSQGVLVAAAIIVGVTATVIVAVAGGIGVAVGAADGRSTTIVATACCSTVGVGVTGSEGRQPITKHIINSSQREKLSRFIISTSWSHYTIERPYDFSASPLCLADVYLIV
jgi:hypothetical protein